MGSNSSNVMRQIEDFMGPIADDIPGLGDLANAQVPTVEECATGEQTTQSPPQPAELDQRAHERSANPVTLRADRVWLSGSGEETLLRLSGCQGRGVRRQLLKVHLRRTWRQCP